MRPPTRSQGAGVQQPSKAEQRHDRLEASDDEDQDNDFAADPNTSEQDGRTGSSVNTCVMRPDTYTAGEKRKRQEQASAIVQALTEADGQGNEDDNDEPLRSHIRIGARKSRPATAPATPPDPSFAALQQATKIVAASVTSIIIDAVIAVAAEPVSPVATAATALRAVPAQTEQTVPTPTAPTTPAPTQPPPPPIPVATYLVNDNTNTFDAGPIQNIPHSDTRTENILTEACLQTAIAYGTLDANNDNHAQLLITNRGGQWVSINMFPQLRSKVRVYGKQYEEKRKDGGGEPEVVFRCILYTGKQYEAVRQVLGVGGW